MTRYGKRTTLAFDEAIMSKKRTAHHAAAIPVLIALCFALALLAGCGTRIDPTQDDQGAQEEPDVEPISIEVADRHLVLERITSYPDVVRSDPEQPGGYSLSFLMAESDVPVFGTRIGAISGFDIWPEIDDITGYPVAVRFEQLDGADGYNARATFYYEGQFESEDIAALDEIRYKTADEDDDHSVLVFSRSAEQIAFVEGGDDWPDTVPTREDLQEGAQDVALDEELLLASNRVALYNALDLWAYDLLHDCCQKLVDDGAMEQLPDDNTNSYFNFDSSPQIVFTDAEAQERLTGELPVELDDAVFCKGTGVYGDYCDVYFNSVSGNEELAQYPSFFPVDDVMDFYSESDSWSISPDHADRFADSLDDCHYLVAYLGIESRRDVDYYDSPKTDRLVVSTLVVVADAQTREFVHIHEVGTDAPGMITDSPAGNVLEDEALEYISSLL